MRKNFGTKPWFYPLPVLIIGTYDENGKADAMNAAWGGLYGTNMVELCLSAGHKTTKNIKAQKAFTVAFADASYNPTISEAAEMSEKLYKMFIGGVIDGAYIIFTEMAGHGKMSPKKIRLLPFERAEVVHENEVSAGEEFALHELEYEPSAEEVLSLLIPQYLTGMIYGALIQSSACEHSSRHSAMNSATTNASRLLESLELEYNRARQESVTGELSEIITASMGGYGNCE